MMLTFFNIEGNVVKQDQRYIVKDNTTLKHLILSSTVLFRNQSTSGHRHFDQEEIYFFIQGSGKMIVGEPSDEPFVVSANDIVLIPDGAYHRVFNDGEMNLIFNCVFQGKRSN